MVTNKTKKKTIMLSLDEEVLEKSKNFFEPFGGSVSKVVEEMLKNWVAKMETNDIKKQKEIQKRYDKKVEEQREILNKLKGGN